MPDRVLFIGDIIGKPGRRALPGFLRRVLSEFDLDLIVANGENAAGGIGITPEVAEEILEAGVDVITTGNHVWHYKEIIPYLEDENFPILRPLNYPEGVPGKGYIRKGKFIVVNLMGRVFMKEIECPFRKMDIFLENIDSGIVLIDFHAEATSEKNALGWYLDGRVGAVVGTHTHVGTIDAKILPKGTAYITDIGMVGPKDSVIGDDVESVIRRFLTLMPHRLSVGKGNVIFNSVLVEFDDRGKAKSIRRIDLEE